MVENQINELKKTVAYDTRDFIIEIIVNKYFIDLDAEKNEIYVPEYQRDFVWDDERQSKLIESIILGLPIPSIFVAEDNDGRLEIVDGSQRIRTLNAFIRDELKLTGLEKVTKLNGLIFSNLDESRQRKFKNTAISMIVLSDAANEETRNDLFERINRGSDTLRNMETRKGIYPGAFNDFIYKKCSPLPEFRKLVHLSKAVLNRQEYEELILRFFALIDDYPKYSDYSKSVRNALDQYMLRKIHNFTQQESDEKFKNFIRMIDFVTKNFPFGFSKGNEKDTSRIFFEAISVGVHFALEENPKIQLKNKINVLDWLNDIDFKKSISSGSKTHSVYALSKRIDFVKNKLLE